MIEFAKKMKAYFVAVLLFAAKQMALNDSIITFLEKQKIVNKKNTDDITALGERQTTSEGKIATLDNRVNQLGQIKGNLEYLPYDYSEDMNLMKPVMRVVDGVEIYPNATDVLDYVSAKLGKPIVNGRSYLVQFSGDTSCPVMVNGKLQSGDAEESFFAVVNDAGERAFTYSSNPNAEKLASIETEAANATKDLEAANVTLVGYQNRMDLLNA